MSHHSDLHTVVFLKGWNEADAERFLKRANLKPIKAVHRVIRKADGVMSQLRYRIRDPALFKSFITKKIKYDNKYINFVIGIY